MQHSEANWTDERIERLKSLLATGMSASKIAADLGGMTRNAVIGKAHRLGLMRERRIASPSEIAERQRQAAAARSRGQAEGARRRIEARAQSKRHAAPETVSPLGDQVDGMVDLPFENIPVGQRCSILELTETSCRWPIGDPKGDEFFFCGGKTVDGLPYCGYHSRIAYQPIAERRRERRGLDS